MNCLYCTKEILSTRKNKIYCNKRCKENAKWYRDKYGIGQSEKREMYKFQNGKCAICGDEYILKKLCIDHNHNSGKVRQLLCNHCNKMIGFSRESTSTLQKAIAYIEKHSS